MNHLADLFDNKRMTADLKAKKFKAAASEVLSLYPILARFVRAGPLARNVCSPQCKAFLDMCSVLDILHAGSGALGAEARTLATPAALRAAVDQSLGACAAAGWSQCMIKKFHWLLHLADAWERYSFLPSCWTLERKHKLVTRYSTPTKNTSQFNKSVLQEALAHDLATLREPGGFGTGVRLLAAHHPTKKLQQTLQSSFSFRLNDEDYTSRTVRLAGGQTCSVGDIVLTDSRNVGEVLLHVSVNGEHYTLLHIFCLLRHEPALHSAAWHKTDEADKQRFLFTRSIRCCLTVAVEGDKVTTLLPFGSR